MNVHGGDAFTVVTLPQAGTTIAPTAVVERLAAVSVVGSRRCTSLCANVVQSRSGTQCCQVRRAPVGRAVVHAAAAVRDVADGRAVAWPSRSLGWAIPKHFAGIDPFQDLQAAVDGDYPRDYLLGARLEVAAADRELGGYLGNGEAPTVVESVRSPGTDLPFLGMVSPDKETCTGTPGPTLVRGTGSSGFRTTRQRDLMPPRPKGNDLVETADPGRDRPYRRGGGTGVFRARSPRAVQVNDWGGRVSEVPFLDIASQQAEIAAEVLPVWEAQFASVCVHRRPGGRSRSSEEYAAYIGVEHCVGRRPTAPTPSSSRCARSASSAGDEVILPANTFIATAEAVSRIGAVSGPRRRRRRAPADRPGRGGGRDHAAYPGDRPGAPVRSDRPDGAHPDDRATVEASLSSRTPRSRRARRRHGRPRGRTGRRRRQRASIPARTSGRPAMPARS